MPPTPKAESKTVTIPPAEPAVVHTETTPQLSSDAGQSTYSPDDDPAAAAEKNPPDGPHVKQELGAA
jgi:hypothetical protein